MEDKELTFESSCRSLSRKTVSPYLTVSSGIGCLYVISEEVSQYASGRKIERSQMHTLTKRQTRELRDFLTDQLDNNPEW